jgi:hypothetical protein
MMSVSFHEVHSLLGFYSLLIVVNQLISGTMLSFSLVPESLMIPLVRDEEDMENL